jgi:hypothetical protein
MTRTITTYAPTSREVSIPDSFDMDHVALVSFFHFLQQIANRRAVGAIRYERNGVPDRRKKYLARLKRELAAYEKSGNHEQLVNIATYAFLESYAPENARYHFDPTAESVIDRKELGGAAR